MWSKGLQWMASAAWKSCGLLLVLTACASTAMAAPSVPEIDPSSIGSALALLMGGLMMLTSRRRNS